MPLVIDDSSFPAPAPLPAFATLAVGDVYRIDGAYRIKMNASSAYDLALSQGLTQDANDGVELVSAVLTISAPE